MAGEKSPKTCHRLWDHAILHEKMQRDVQTWQTSNMQRGLPHLCWPSLVPLLDARVRMLGVTLLFVYCTADSRVAGRLWTLSSSYRISIAFATMGSPMLASLTKAPSSGSANCPEADGGRLGRFLLLLCRLCDCLSSS